MFLGLKPPAHVAPMPDATLPAGHLAADRHQTLLGMQHVFHIEPRPVNNIPPGLSNLPAKVWTRADGTFGLFAVWIRADLIKSAGEFIQLFIVLEAADRWCRSRVDTKSSPSWLRLDIASPGEVIW